MFLWAAGYYGEFRYGYSGLGSVFRVCPFPLPLIIFKSSGLIIYSVCRAVLSDHTGLIGQLSLQNNTLVAGDNRGTVKLWSLPERTGQTIAEDEEGDPVISLVIDGERILFGYASGSAYLVHRGSGAREVLVTGADVVWSVGFTPAKRPWVVYRRGKYTWLHVL